MSEIKKQNKTKGRRGEALAARYLEKHKGHRLVELNFRCFCGEIDIISQAGETLVFTEVKYRQTTDYGSPGQAVNHKKREHIIRTAYWYMNAHPSDYNNIRFDIVEIVENESGRWIRHLENAFQIES